MLTVFNRHELAVLHKAEQQAMLRDILSQNSIKYKVKTLNRKSPSAINFDSRARTGTLMENLSAEYEYKIYVHKKDYEKALSLLIKINMS